MDNLIFFDLETDGLGTKEAPAAIVAAVTRKNGVFTCWHEADPQKISHATARALALELVSNEWVVSFNGCSFDFYLVFKHLSEEDQKSDLGKQLAYKTAFEHYDIMFDFFTTKGYRSSMESFLIGCKLKKKIWNGAESALSWKENFEKVIEYCKGDVKALEDLCLYAEANKCLKRVSKSGKTSVWALYHDGRFRTPHECVAAWKEMPVDQSWMDEPEDPQKILLWVARVLKN